MLSKMFGKRFEIGDTVRLIRSGQKAVIIDKGSLPLARKHITTFVLKFEDGGPSDGDAGGYRADSVTGFAARARGEPKSSCEF